MRLRLLTLLALAAMLLAPGASFAQGAFVSPVPPMPPAFDTPPPPDPGVLLIAPGPVTLDLYRVTADIKDQVATTHVEQTFSNPGDRPVEATYFFPIPQDAAITEFNMVVDGQVVEGQLMGKEQARAIYEDIVRQQRDPALLEYVGRDLFQARIFPIPPGGQRTIELTYSQVLPKENSLVRYTYPLRVYPLLQVGRRPEYVQPIGQLAIRADIEATSPIKAIYSPTHSIAVTRDGEFKAVAGYEGSNVIPTSDFDLFYSVDEGEIGLSLLSYKPAGEDGYFLLLAAPNVDVNPEEVVARDVILVLDTSGSMDGAKIQQARQAALYVLDRLNPDDRFNIVTFSTGVRQFDRGPQPLSRLGDARAFVNDLTAAGGTDINRALLEAVAQVDPDRPAVIIFLTDGLPTEGEVNPERIVENVRQNAPDNAQVFSFGVGYDVNTVLLDTVSQENSGVSAYVQPGQAIDEIVSGFYAKVATPVLSNLALDTGSVFVEDSFPYPLPDLFAGSQLVLAGRYRDGGPAVVTLTGDVNGNPREFRYDDLTFRSEGGDAFIARLWATRKVGYLLNEIRLRGANQELVDEVVRLASKYGIATPYTSFFVPEPTFVGGQGGQAPVPMATVVLQAMEAPKLVEQAADAMMAAPAAPAAGAAAVQESVARQSLSSADRATAGDFAAGLRYADDKTFVNRGGAWVDTAFTADQPQQEIAFGSAAYFDLLTQHPDWRDYFAVSPNLIVVLDGTAYVIADSGETMAEPPVAPTTASQPVTATVAAPSPAEAAVSPVPADVTPAPLPTDAVAAAPPPAQPDQQAPLCTGPAFAIGLVGVTGVLARRRRHR
ncbi:MAG: VWA domain-containing protein [Anaerolineales bacterium]|nr:VWA domain-containing protein [Anaerolineales bacterium]